MICFLGAAGRLKPPLANFQQVRKGAKVNSDFKTDVLSASPHISSTSQARLPPLLCRMFIDQNAPASNRGRRAQQTDSRLLFRPFGPRVATGGKLCSRCGTTFQDAGTLALFSRSLPNPLTWPHLRPPSRPPSQLSLLPSTWCSKLGRRSLDTPRRATTPSGIRSPLVRFAVFTL